MPFLTSHAERTALRAGDNILGGSGPDAVEIASLMWDGPAARITVRPDGSAVIQRLSAKLVVSIDDQALGAAAQTLHHGARISGGRSWLVYEGPVVEAPGAAPVVAPVPSAGEPTRLAFLPVPQDAAMRVLVVKTGEEIPLNGGDVMIGRDSSCDIVLSGPGVSRVHATICRSGRRVTLEDASANGTYVNGERVTTKRELRDGDLIAIHEEELRFVAAAPEAAPLPAPPVDDPDGATRLFAAGDPAAGRAPGAASRPAPAPRKTSAPLATLEVVRGPLSGQRFSVERPVSAIGRGSQSDIRVNDDSVSASHATLLLKGEAWSVIDLHSSNGTFVDGYRVAGERALGGGSTLKLGSVELVFRPVTGSARDAGVTQNLGNLIGRLSKLWQDR